MKICVLVIVAWLFLLVIPYREVYGEGRIKYAVQVDSNGSATWVIKQTADINASLDTLVEFEDKVTLLVEAAKNKTQRDMVAPLEFMSVTYTPSGSYVTVEYKFYWEDFSKIENTSITIGDAFQTQDFFLRLFGDGEIYITYPSQYIVEVVSPPPSERNDSLQTLGWLGTNDLSREGTMVVLREKSASLGFIEALAQNAIPIAGLAILAAVSLIGFYVLRRRKKKETEPVKTPELATSLTIESGEDTIVKLLRSSGGSLFQSTIVEKCRFSKAKTSQLLASLENRGIVSRCKKGRDKIVTLIKQNEE